MEKGIDDLGCDVKTVLAALKCGIVMINPITKKDRDVWFGDVSLCYSLSKDKWLLLQRFSDHDFPMFVYVEDYGVTWKVRGAD